MDIGPGTEATLLELALDGEPVEDQDVLALAALAAAVGRVEQSGLEPRGEFVSSLRARLLDGGSEIAVGRVDSTPASDGSAPTAGGRRSHDTATTVVRLRRPRPRAVVAGIAASLVLVATLVGLLSRTALPGDTLYPVKQLLDRAAVGLSGSRLDEGRTHLAQAQQHISEARDLLDRGAPAPVDLGVAFDAATTSVTSARSVLLEVYAQENRPDALTDLADFVTRALPQVDAMDHRVPAGARPAYDRLHAALTSSQSAVLRALAECAGCGDAARGAQAALAVIGAAGAVEAAGTQDAAAPASPAAPVPSVTVAGPGITVATDGVTVDGGGVALPGATLQLPGAGIASTDVVVGGGGLTLPGATVPLPTLSVPLPALTTTSSSLLPEPPLP